MDLNIKNFSKFGFFICFLKRFLFLRAKIFFFLKDLCPLLLGLILFL
jgi:hypothetical protein